MGAILNAWLSQTNITIFNGLRNPRTAKAAVTSYIREGIGMGTGRDRYI